MPSVTVDLDDLETIVMTTGALKTIEGALNARKNDPFVHQYLDFSEAHDRLSSAMRNAKRADAGTLVPWDGKTTGILALAISSLSTDSLIDNSKLFVGSTGTNSK